MTRLMSTARVIGASSLLLMMATPALAEGKADRARAAIAEATGKTDAASKLGASGEVPRLQAEAQAALRTAREDLASGRKDEAIAGANHASQLADLAIGQSQKNAEAAEREHRAAAGAAIDSARIDAAAANERAEAAQRSAAMANADAAAARAAPPPAPVIVAMPPPATTTVTTETVAPRVAAAPVRTAQRKTVRRVVRHGPAPVSRPVTDKTTTTVTTTQN